MISLRKNQKDVSQIIWQLYQYPGYKQRLGGDQTSTEPIPRLGIVFGSEPMADAFPRNRLSRQPFCCTSSIWPDRRPSCFRTPPRGVLFSVNYFCRALPHTNRYSTKVVASTKMLPKIRETATWAEASARWRSRYLWPLSGTDSSSPPRKKQGGFSTNSLR